jgi:hypothetical protein
VKLMGGNSREAFGRKYASRHRACAYVFAALGVAR